MKTPTGEWNPVSISALTSGRGAASPVDNVFCAAKSAHLWAIHTQPVAARATWAAGLSSEALAQVDEAATPQQQESRLTWLAVELILAHYADIPLSELQLALRGSGRKPRLDPEAHPDCPLKFNLSHSGGWSLLALSHGNEVGVDLERQREFREPLRFAQRFLHRRELVFLAALPESDRSEALRQLWVRKEAAAKATGFGLPMGLNSFSALGDEPPLGGHWIELTLPKARTEGDMAWSLCDIPAPDNLVAAFCVEGPLVNSLGPALRFFQLESPETATT